MIELKCKNCGEEVVSKYVEFSAVLFFIVGVSFCIFLFYNELIRYETIELITPVSIILSSLINIYFIVKYWF